MRLLHSLASPPDLWTTALGPGVSWGTLLFPGCPILPSQRLQGSPCPPRSCQASLTDLPFSARPQLPEGPPKHRAAQAPPDQRLSISSLTPSSVPTAQWALGVTPRGLPVVHPLLHACSAHWTASHPQGPLSAAPPPCPRPWQRHDTTGLSHGLGHHTRASCATLAGPHPHGALPVGLACSRPTPKNHKATACQINN